jgi:hypothetical protein
MLEGDEIITVNGADVLHGTGLEDAYNGGYYYNWVAVQADEPEGVMPQSATRPLHGILYVGREAGYARADQYRWQIADRIPFSRSLDVKIENRYAVTGAVWTSVAFWYQQPPIPADTNEDGDVDLADFAALQVCFGGVEDACLSRFDEDADLLIGLADLAAFLSDFTGAWPNP